MQVFTKNGALCGEDLELISVFKGVPYAKPPVGDLRWKPPLPAENWEGVRQATEFGPAAAQPSFAQNYAGSYLTNDDVRSEDCLYLNIWTPKAAIEENKALPVLFVIHGGGFKFFSGTTSALNGLALAERDIVVVTINYRLGIMGFFAHPELSGEDANHVSGNYGILDQIAALKWVRDNIAAFGGDPEQITICGESAGAFSVSVLCASPLAKGMFLRAAAQSGAFMDTRTVMFYQRTLAEAETHFANVCEGKSLEELRRMSADEMIAFGENPEVGSFTPIRDGFVFPLDNRQAIRDGQFSDVPLLIGSNCDEGTLFAPQTVKAGELEALAVKLAGQEKVAEFLKVYPNHSPEAATRSMIQLIGDSAFGHGMYVWAKLQTLYGKSDAYLYYYCLVSPGSEFGAHHSSELSYFFHNLYRAQKDWTQKDYDLERIYSSYLLNFVKFGNPNGEGVPEWKPFGAEPERILIMDAAPHMAPNPTLNAMRFWDTVCEV